MWCSRPISTLNTQDQKDERQWYLSLHRSFENLKSLRNKIENELIPEMVETTEKLSSVNLSVLSNRKLADEIKNRAALNQKWVDIYWAEFIPYAHGIRLFGQVYNDTVNPQNPYEFIDLLAQTGMASMERNRQMEHLASMLRKDPVMAILPSPTHHFLKNLGKKLGRPKAVVCISAHWETYAPMLSGAVYPETITDIPVIQLSIQGDLGPDHHFHMGETLARLRGEGVLIMGSGGATHNLEDIHGRKMHDQPVPYAVNFDTWLEKTITSGDITSLLDYKRQGPEAEKNHPYPSDHFLPLFVPLGAAKNRIKGELIHKEFIYGILSLAAYMWL